MSTCENLVALIDSVESLNAVNRADLVRVVCTQCDKVEVCPSVGEREYEQRQFHGIGDLED